METLKWGALQGSPWPSKFWGWGSGFHHELMGQSPHLPLKNPGFILMLINYGEIDF